MIHYFVWNGTDCRDKHISIPNRIPVIRPEERVQHVTIPGRSGDVTLTEGEAVFQSYIVTIRITVLGHDNIPEAENWLRGEGQVSFSSQPDRIQNARIIGAITFEKHSRNLDIWHGDVQFYCEPIKYDPNEQAVSVTSSGTSISNPGDMTAYPLIEIAGSGAVSVKIGNRTLTIPECVTGMVIDTENEWILSGNAPQMDACSGDFPLLEKGTNIITYSGNISQLLITPRIRYI